MSRPVPLWVVLVGILTTASVATAITLGPRLFNNRPDFQVQSELSSVQTLRHLTGYSFRVFVRSQNGFSGVVSMTVTPSNNLNAWIWGGIMPQPPTGPIVLLGTNDSLRVDVSSSITGNYTVTVTGSSNGVSHSTTIPVVIQDFAASASPSSVTVVAGQNVSSTIKISGVNGLGGPIYLIAGSTAPGHNPNVNFGYGVQLSNVSFSNGTDCSARLTGQNPPPYTYNCVYKLLPIGGSLTANVTINTSTQDAGTTWTVTMNVEQNSVQGIPQTVASVTVN